MKRHRLRLSSVVFPLLAAVLVALTPLGPARPARAADPCGTRPDDYVGVTYRLNAPETTLRITFRAGGVFEYELGDGVIHQGTYTATPQAVSLVTEGTDRSVFRGCDGTSATPGVIVFPGGIVVQNTS